MPKKSDEQIITGLDIGTSKVVAVVGKVTEDGQVEVIGVGSQPSRGVKKGVVVNIDSTVQAVEAAIEEAEKSANCSIDSVYTGVAGNHIGSRNSHGVVAIRHQEVTPLDIERVLEAARTIAIPADQKILHTLCQEYSIDNQEGIREPLGMSGVRLEAKVHIVTSSVSAIQNVVNCVRRCGLDVDDVVLEQLASSYSAVTEDEKQLGVCLIDIGGGTTDIAVFVDGVIRHTAVIPVAGSQVTNDIAVTLHVPTATAEALKIEYGCAIAQLVGFDEVIDKAVVGERGGRALSCQSLAKIIESRYEELFAMVREELEQHQLLELLGSGIVLTGGSAMIDGALELAEEMFHLPVRLGFPEMRGKYEELLENPIYSTGVGLMLYGCAHRAERRAFQRMGMQGIFGRVKNWLQGNF